MVMGHEIAHALREHARERAAKNTLTNAGGRIIGALIFGSGAGELIGAAGGNLLTLRFSRNDELESDLIGMELSARAGYDPLASSDMLAVLGQEQALEARVSGQDSSIPTWMSTHPNSADRVRRARDWSAHRAACACRRRTPAWRSGLARR